MSQKLPVNVFKWKKNVFKFDKDFIKNYDVDSDKGYILEKDVEYPNNMHDFYSDLPFLAERMEINKRKKVVCNMIGKINFDKNNVVHIKALKQALNYGLTLKKVHRVIQFNQEAWLKPYIGMNTKLKTSKIHFEKDFFKLMNNSLFGKTMENVKKHRDIKLVTTDKRKNQLVSESNYHTIKYFSDYFSTEMKKIELKMNKLVYLSIPTLKISKTLMYEFWCEYIKLKYQNNAKLCCMDTDSFIIHMKSEDFYKDIDNDVEKWFDTSDYSEDYKRPLPRGRTKKY